MLPSASSAVSQRPSPGSGSKTSAVQGRAPRAARLAHRLRDHVDAEHRRGRVSASAAVIRPGPQPMSIVAPAAVREHGPVGRVGVRQPGMRSASGASAEVVLPHRAGMTLQGVRVDAGERKRRHAVTDRQAGANRPPVRPPATACAPRRRCRRRSARGADRDGLAGRGQGLAGAATRVGSRHRYARPGRRPRDGVAERQDPPAPVGGRAEDGVAVGRGRGDRSAGRRR